MRRSDRPEARCPVFGLASAATCPRLQTSTADLQWLATPMPHVKLRLDVPALT
jgi:hypothetical protein